jgi:hypothetical protein
MKTIIYLPSLVAALFLCSCQTLQNLTPTIAGIAGLAAEYGVRKLPQYRTQFANAEASLTILIDAKNWSAVEFEAALLKIPAIGPGLAGPNGDLYLSAGVLVFDLVQKVSYKVTTPADR